MIAGRGEKSNKIMSFRSNLEELFIFKIFSINIANNVSISFHLLDVLQLSS